MATQFENTLVVYYSRTGRCSKIAHALGEMLEGCDIERIEDERDMTGMKGLAQMSMKALMRKGSEISPTRFSPEWYDEIFLVTPVWAGSIAPAVRTYLKHRKLAKLNLIACSGWTSESGCKDELHREYGITVNHHLRFVIDEVDEDKFRDKLRRFVFPQEYEVAPCEDDETPPTPDSPSGFSFDNKEDAMSKNSENKTCCPSKKTAATDTKAKSTAKSRACNGTGADETRCAKGTQKTDKTATKAKSCGTKCTPSTRACSASSTADTTTRSAKNARGNIVARGKNTTKETTKM